MERDLRIDFLRFVGLSLVILAHVQAPFTLTQIRSFDVPLIVFVSGLTSSSKIISNYWQYVWKRTKRLVIPVWFFLTVYLTTFYFLQGFLLSEKYLTGTMILRSFLLLDHSIGYVWIIRVFLLVMFITPFVMRLSATIKTDTNYIIILILTLLLNQILFQLFSVIEEKVIQNFLTDTILYGVAYSIPFALGVRLRSYIGKNVLTYIISFVVVFLLLMINCKMAGNNPIGVSQGYKFPPRPYFIIYGSLVSIILWSTRDLWGILSKGHFVSFVGQNTLWIYLWHMPFALFATVFINNWVISYFFVYLIALLSFRIQYLIVKKLNKPLLNKYLLG